MSLKTFDVFKFLENYQMYPCLWDRSHQDYKSRLKRESAEEELLPLSGFPSVKELRAKIRSLRGTYNQEIAKIKASIRCGATGDEVYKPKLAWFYFADSFLKKSHLDEYDEESDMKAENEDENSTSFDESFAGPEIAIVCTPDNSLLENSLGYRGREWSRSGGREKRRKIADIDLESRFDSQPWTSECYDQFDAIGKIIGGKLRRMEESQRDIAEYLVNNILYYGLRSKLSESTSISFY